MDKKRFWNEFNIVIAHSWKLDTAILAIMFTTTLAIIVVLMSDVFNDGTTLQARADNCLTVSSMLGVIAMAVYCSMQFGDLADKSHQIRLMMNPSSVAEKFWTRILHTFIVTVLLSEVVFNAAILLWMAFQTAETRMATWDYMFEQHQHNDIVKAMSESSFFPVMNTTILLCYVSAYAVGVTYFRKHPFLHTSLVLTGGFLLLLFAIGFVIGFFIGVLGHDSVVQNLPDIGTGVAMLTVLNIVVCALLLYWAYCRFARLQFKNYKG